VSEHWSQAVREASRSGESLVDLSTVAAWISRNRHLWVDGGLTVEVFAKSEGTPKNSIHLNIDGPAFMSTTIIWDSGEWEVSFGHLGADDVQTSEYEPAESTAEVIQKIQRALGHAGIPTCPD